MRHLPRHLPRGFSEPALLVLAGQKCETLLDRLVRGVEVEDVQADELWSFVRMKT